MFILKARNIGEFTWWKTAMVFFYGDYFVNTDSPEDFGKLEFSPNNGRFWIDMINDSVLIDTAKNVYWSWKKNKPLLTGNSHKWTPFNVDILDLGKFYKVDKGDTIQFRFTFISDNKSSSNDG